LDLAHRLASRRIPQANHLAAGRDQLAVRGNSNGTDSGDVAFAVAVEFLAGCRVPVADYWTGAGRGHRLAVRRVDHPRGPVVLQPGRFLAHVYVEDVHVILGDHGSKSAVVVRVEGEVGRRFVLRQFALAQLLTAGHVPDTQ